MKPAPGRRTYYAAFSPSLGYILILSVSSILSSVHAYSLMGTYFSTVDTRVSAAISVSASGAVTVTWLTVNRRNANGIYNATSYSGSVSFPDDRKHRFVFDVNTGFIYWDSPDNVWRQLYLVDLSGRYGTTSSGNLVAVISVTNGSDQFLNARSQRPIVKGNFYPISLSGSVNFVDDKIYKFTFDPVNGVITWNTPGNVWYRAGVVSMSGTYSSTLNGKPSAVISSNDGNGDISVLFLNSNRPIASGKFNAQTLSGSVSFSDDRTYTFIFNPASGIINWDNAALWYRQLAASPHWIRYAQATNTGQWPVVQCSC